MDEIRSILLRRCKDLIAALQLESINMYGCVPIARYIMAIPYAIPIRHIVLAERPYRTNIFPYVASAMSYDPDLQDTTTPAVHFMALDISNADDDISYLEARDWFRDSWKYLQQGIVLLNVCTTRQFMDNTSERERVYMEEFVRDMITVSHMVYPEKTHIWALGSPAKHSAGRIRSGTLGARKLVTVHDSKNPASFKHRGGDTMSPAFTLECKSFTRTFRQVIKTSRQGVILTSDRYITMASGTDDLNSLVGRGAKLVDTFQDISAYFKNNASVTAESNDELFKRASDEMREFVEALGRARIRTLFLNTNENTATSKPAFYNKRSGYNASQYSAGTSTKQSNRTPASSKKISLGFADADADDTSASAPIETPKTTAPPSVSMSNTPTTPSRPPRASSVTSRGGGRTVSLGFADESEDERIPTIPESPKSSGSDSGFKESMNAQEIGDMSIISDFIDPSNEKYRINKGVADKIADAVRSKRATSKESKAVLQIIRDSDEMRMPGAIANDLGYGDKPDHVIVGSDIMQWILKNAVSK